MFIIDLNYIVPLEKLDAHMAAHVKYLQKTTARTFLLFPEGKYPAQAASSWRL
jgi:uncharacterized protein YciI